MAKSRNFEYAVFLPAKDLKADFLGCILDVVSECDGSTVFCVRHFNTILEVCNIEEVMANGAPSYELHFMEEALLALGIDAEEATRATETMQVMQELVKAHKPFSEAVEIAVLLNKAFIFKPRK